MCFKDYCGSQGEDFCRVRVDSFGIVMVYVEFQDQDGNELGHKNAMNIPPFQEGQSLDSEMFDGVWVIEKVHHIVNDDVWGIMVRCRPAGDEVWIGDEDE